MPDIRSYGPGKFNTLIDEAVYHLAADGADEELAEVGFGSRQLLRGGLDLSEAIPHAQTPLNDAEVDFLTRQIGAILTETSDGFITVDYYEDPELLDARLSHAGLSPLAVYSLAFLAFWAVTALASGLSLLLAED